MWSWHVYVAACCLWCWILQHCVTEFVLMFVTLFVSLLLCDIFCQVSQTSREKDANSRIAAVMTGAQWLRRCSALNIRPWTVHCCPTTGESHPEKYLLRPALSVLLRLHSEVKGYSVRVWSVCLKMRYFSKNMSFCSWCSHIFPYIPIFSHIFQYWIAITLCREKIHPPPFDTFSEK